MRTNGGESFFIPNEQRQAIVAIGFDTQQVVKRREAITLVFHQHGQIFAMRTGIANEVIKHHPALHLHQIGTAHRQVSQSLYQKGDADKPALALVLSTRAMAQQLATVELVQHYDVARLVHTVITLHHVGGLRHTEQPHIRHQQLERAGQLHAGIFIDGAGLMALG